MAQRAHYWSCSRFANWLRGTDKPPAATGKGWDTWHKLAKKKHKFRYWLAEEGLDAIQDVIWWPVDKLYDIKYYINNRWVTKTHALTAHSKDIPRGEWRDVGNRFLPCLFNELVEFVEIELAWSQIAWSKENRIKYNAPIWSRGWFRWRTWRCPEAGLDNLKWQMNLIHDDEWVKPTDPKYGTPTAQAIAAKEIYDLYNWWKTVYPNRKDPYDASGWTDYCNMRSQKGYGFFDLDQDTEEDKKIKTDALDLIRKIEEAYDAEDTEMLIRLIKIRNNLWT